MTSRPEQTHSETAERLRDNADLSEKALPFYDDNEFADETSEDILLWRTAADALDALEARLERAEKERDDERVRANTFLDVAHHHKERRERAETALREVVGLDHRHLSYPEAVTSMKDIARAYFAAGVDAERLQFNPGPLEVVERRDNVTAVQYILGRSREDRLRVWLALGGTEADFPVAAERTPE